MFNVRLETENLFLVSLEKKLLYKYIEDGKSNYFSWFGDEVVTQHNSHGLFPQSNSEVENYLKRCESDKSLSVFMISCGFPTSKSLT